MQWNKTYSTIALAKSAMERIPLHSWEMEFSIQYHVTINSQLNDQNSIRYYSSVIFAHFKAKVGIKNSKKLKIVRCNHLTILNNILKVPMYLSFFHYDKVFFDFPLLPYC